MKKIGIIGGGQLGLMIAEQAKLLGAKTICLDPSEVAPAFAVCDEHIVARFDNLRALEELCRRSDVVTYEFENIPSEVLVPLVERYNIPQGYRPLFDSQDRAREKLNARVNGLNTADFVEVDGWESLLSGVVELGFPLVFKTRQMGYDGHGQVVLRGEGDIAKIESYRDVPAILERFVEFDYEASIIMVSDGERVINFPIGQNIHRDGILDLCLIPAPRMSLEIRDKIERESLEFMHRCGYVGIVAIEYFVCGEKIYFNEMAPRPHNSGHYTIEGCTTNQFRELCRFLLGEPLTTPELIAPTVMKNILGEDLEQLQKLGHSEGVFVHLYGKKESRPKRKMGHVTFVGMDERGYASEWSGVFK